MSKLPCESCGSGLQGHGNAGDVYQDADKIICGDCGATNCIHVDAEDVHVMFFRCRHDKLDDETCDLCEIEEMGGIGEVAS